MLFVPSLTTLVLLITLYVVFWDILRETSCNTLELDHFRNMCEPSFVGAPQDCEILPACMSTEEYKSSKSVGSIVINVFSLAFYIFLRIIKKRSSKS